MRKSRFRHKKTQNNKSSCRKLLDYCEVCALFRCITMSVFSIIILSALGSTIPVIFAATCNKGKPVGYAWDNEASLGVWYQYMHGPKTNPLDNLTSMVEENRGIGWMSNANKPTFISAVTSASRQPAAPHKCQVLYATHNTTYDGFASVLGYLGGMGETGMPGTFYKLYLDPNFVYIKSFCLTGDLLTGNCNDPSVSVWTRKMPKKITPLEGKIIRQIIDDRLQFLCLTVNDFVTNDWIDSLPSCDYTGRPQSFLDDMRFAQENLVNNFKYPGSGICSPASPPVNPLRSSASPPLSKLKAKVVHA